MNTIDLDRLELSDGHVVLDAGCGEGRHVRALRQHGDLEAVGVDMRIDRLKQIRGEDGASDKVRLYAADITRLPFQSGSFDAVICSEVFEHIPLWQRAAHELTRVLRGGGVFAVSVPARMPEMLCWALSKKYRTTPGGHVRIFREDELKAGVQAAGMIYLGKHYAHALHVPYWWLRCLFDKDPDHHPVVGWYRRRLEAEMFGGARMLTRLDRWAAPHAGKSVVMYFRKPADSQTLLAS